MKRIASFVVALALAASAYANVTINLSDSAAQELRTQLGSTSVVQPPVVQPPIVQPAASTVKYAISKLTVQDRMYLLKMDTTYRSALAKIPGAHQIWFDVVSDDLGRLFAEMPDGSTQQQALRLKINAAINDTSYNTPELTTFDFTKYTGPLKSIVANVIAAKLAGK